MNKAQDQADHALSQAYWLTRETELLRESGYFDEHGMPRSDEQGKEIFAKVVEQLRQESIAIQGKDQNTLRKFFQEYIDAFEGDDNREQPLQH
jgi:hypothetical protein